MGMSPTKIDLDLHAFGNAKGPRAPRLGKDITADEEGMMGPEPSKFPSGMSVFGDPYPSELTGHIWRLPNGTQLPEGLD
ncbi:hypothetical protein BH23PLA1_BH23PLA1_21840 [soil metagenome]